MVVEFDQVLQEIGPFDKYQKLLFCFVLFPVCFPGGLHQFSQLFMQATPAHWCRPFNLTNDVLGGTNWSSGKPPFQSGTTTNGGDNDSCFYTLRHAGDYSGNSLDSQAENLTENQLVPSEDTTNCQRWEYETETYTRTIVSDWDLVCNKVAYPTISNAVFFLGAVIGLPVFGFLCDRFGRKISYFVCLTVQFLFTFATAFAPEFFSWTLFRFLVGSTLPAIFHIPFILSLELVEPAKRTFVGVWSNFFRLIGSMLVATCAYFVRDWRHLALATSVPLVIFYGFWWVLPESPRWLLLRERVVESEIFLQKVAKINRRPLSRNYLQQIKEETQATLLVGQKSHRFAKLSNMLSASNSRKKLFLIVFLWFVLMPAAHGLYLYAPPMYDQIHINIIITIALEFAILLIMWPVIVLCGRRWPLAACLALGGASWIAVAALPSATGDWLDLVRVAFCGTAKFGTLASMLILQIFTVELLPTSICGTGLCSASAVGMLGVIACQVLVDRSDFDFVIFVMVLGVLMTFSAFAGALLLPETAHRRLAATVDDSEDLQCPVTCADIFSCQRTKLADTLTDHHSVNSWVFDELPDRAEYRRSMISNVVPTQVMESGA